MALYTLCLLPRQRCALHSAPFTEFPVARASGQASLQCQPGGSELFACGPAARNLDHTSVRQVAALYYAVNNPAWAPLTLARSSAAAALVFASSASRCALTTSDFRSSACFETASACLPLACRSASSPWILADSAALSCVRLPASSL